MLSRSDCRNLPERHAGSARRRRVCRLARRRLINSAVAAADRLNKQFGAPFTLAEGEMLLSASVGITLSRGSDTSTPESLLREANVTMQGAKKKGKSRYTVFDPGAESTTGGVWYKNQRCARLSRTRSSETTSGW